MNLNLTGGLVSLIDDNIDKKIIAQKWYASKNGKNYYAKAIIKRKSVYLHRVLLNAKKGEIVDHINGNTLDNRLNNLRIVNASQNSGNSKQRINKKYSKLKGVHYMKNRKKPWTSRIQVLNKTIHLGYFLTEVEAFFAYKKAHLKYFQKHSNFMR